MTDETAMAEPTPAPAAGDRRRVLVAYASRHGSTRGIAQRLAARLREAELAVDVAAVTDVAAIEPYAAVVLGAPVYDGRWPPEASELAARERSVLAERPLWLFSVGSFGDTKRIVGPLMRREPRDIAELQATLMPRDYRVSAGVVERDMWPLASRVLFHLFGGRLGDHRDWDAIDGWARAIALELGSG